MGYFDFYHNELSDQQIDELHGIMAIHEAAGMPPFQAALQAAKDKLQQARENQAEVKRLVFESISKKDIDAGAHQAATSPKNDLPEPTPAQQAAGNYAKGSIYLYGLDIAIENPEGSTRKGVSPDGKAWESRMYHHYGYIRKTEGADGDHVDVFVGSQPNSDKVFVIDQVNPDGKFDEHKVMLAFRTLADARKAYLKNYEEGWQGLGAITEMSVDEFKEWLKDGDTLKPVDGAIPGVDDPILESAVEATLSSFTRTLQNHIAKALSTKREDIYGMYDNNLQPVGIIPNDCASALGISDHVVYCGLAHFIDHHFNNHPSTPVAKYKRIDDILANPEEVRQDLRAGKPKTYAFIKYYDNFHCVVIDASLEGSKLVIYKTFFEQTKKPYKNLPLVWSNYNLGVSGEVGSSSIGHDAISDNPAGNLSSHPETPDDSTLPLTPDAVKPVLEAAGDAYDYRTAIEQATTFEDIQAVFARVFPPGHFSVMEKRNIWIPNMKVSKLEKLLSKPQKTADDIEDLKDFKYFLLTDEQSATEKGFMTSYKADKGYVHVLKNKFWLVNIDNAIKEADK